MQTVNTYKGLTYKLYLLGLFKATDSFIVGGILVVSIFLFPQWMLIEILVAGAVFFGIQKIKNRSDEYLRYLFMFITTPTLLNVKYYNDIEAYGRVKNAADITGNDPEVVKKT